MVQVIAAELQPSEPQTADPQLHSLRHERKEVSIMIHTCLDGHPALPFTMRISVGRSVRSVSLFSVNFLIAFMCGPSHLACKPMFRSVLIRVTFFTMLVVTTRLMKEVRKHLRRRFLVAESVGEPRATATVFRLCSKGGLTHLSILDVIRFPPTNVQAFIGSRQQCSR